MQTDSNLTAQQHITASHTVVVYPTSVLHNSTPRPPPLGLKQTLGPFDNRNYYAPQGISNMDHVVYPPMVSAFSQPLAQPNGPQFSPQRSASTMLPGMPLGVQPFTTAVQSSNVISGQCATVVHERLPQHGVYLPPVPASPFGPIVQSNTVFPFDVPPPGYSPSAPLATAAPYSYPPPSSCACIVPTSFPLQCSQLSPPTYAVMHHPGGTSNSIVGASVPVSGVNLRGTGVPIPVGAMPLPISGSPAGMLPVIYNMCVPLTDQQQAYQISIESDFARSTSVTQEIGPTTVQQSGVEELPYGYERSVSSSTFQKSSTTSMGRKTRRERTNPKYKTKPCNKYSENGYCPYGDQCQFIHDPQDLLESTVPSTKGTETKSPFRQYKKTNGRSECVTQSWQSPSPPSAPSSSPEMASRLFSSTPISVPRRGFRENPQIGSDPRVPPGKKVAYLHDFSAGYKKPKVIDGAHSAPLARTAASTARKDRDHRNGV